MMLNIFGNTKDIKTDKNVENFLKYLLSYNHIKSNFRDRDGKYYYNRLEFIVSCDKDYLIISYERDEISSEIIFIASSYMGALPFVRYQMDSEANQHLMDTLEWNIKNPDKRFEDLTTKPASELGFHVINPEKYGNDNVYQKKMAA